MTSRFTLGVVGTVAALLIVSGNVLGYAVAGGLGGLVGLLLAFMLSGWMLRTHFVRREAAGRDQERR
jgi:hypothetical protein